MGICCPNNISEHPQCSQNCILKQCTHISSLCASCLGYLARLTTILQVSKYISLPLAFTVQETRKDHFWDVFHTHISFADSASFSLTIGLVCFLSVCLPNSFPRVVSSHHHLDFFFNHHPKQPWKNTALIINHLAWCFSTELTIKKMLQ